jgi:regulator of ribonuclease activity A
MSIAPRATADLCDALGEGARVLPHQLRDFGGRPAFSGPIRTLSVFEDNALVRAALESAGEGCVLVVDGRGSCRTALVGGNLGKLAERNGWAGVVVWGAVRDTDELRACTVGIRALASCPRKSAKLGAGVPGGALTIGEVEVREGEWLAADADGIVVCAAAPTS